MRRRLSRLLARKHRTTVSDPPKMAEADGGVAVKLKSAIAGLRETAGTDAAIHEMCDGVENLLRQGWTVREGGPEPRRWPLHEAWGGKEPPSGLSPGISGNLPACLQSNTGQKSAD